MHKLLILILTSVALALPLATEAQTTVPNPVIEIIRRGTIKVIKAFDLMVQRIQTKTIWLQNATKTLENHLSKLKLEEIAKWTTKQRDLYKKYYEELWKVRTTISASHRIALIINRQKQIVDQYKFTWRMVNQDKHFSSSEVDYMYRVYTGILRESAQNVEQLLLIVNAYKTQMSDAKRLEAIDRVAEAVEQNYSDLNSFNQQNIRLSLNRAKDLHEIQSIKNLYGLQ